MVASFASFANVALLMDNYNWMKPANNSCHVSYMMLLQSSHLISVNVCMQKNYIIST